MDVEERTTTVGKIIGILNSAIPLLLFIAFLIQSLLSPSMVFFLLGTLLLILGILWMSLISQKVENYIDRIHKWPKDISKTIDMDDIKITLDIQKSQDLTLCKTETEVRYPQDGIWKMNVEKTSVLNLDLEPDACDIMISSGRIEEIIKVLVEMADNGTIEQDDTLTTTDVKAMISIM